MISVIVPVYNVEQYLSECVQSVLRLQSEFELILVDDGSTDASGALCDSLAQTDSRIRVIHQKNTGLSGARNTGIRNSRGEYVMFLDSDDFLDPEQTDAMLGKLADTPLLLGLYRCYYTESDRYEPERCDGFLSHSGKLPIEQFLPLIQADGRGCYMIACRFVVNREFLLENDLFFLEGIYHEDEEWTQRLLCRADSIIVTHNYFYQYRQAREGAITSSVGQKHITDIFEIIRRGRQLLQTLKPEEARAVYLRSRMAGLYLNNMIYCYAFGKENGIKNMRQLKADKAICLSNLRGTKGTAVKLCTGLLGLNITCCLLHRLSAWRNRKGK